MNEDLVENLITEIQCRIMLDIKLADELRTEFRSLLKSKQPAGNKAELSLLDRIIHFPAASCFTPETIEIIKSIRIKLGGK